MAMISFQAVSVKSNPNDISPEYAGVINGIDAVFCRNI